MDQVQGAGGLDGAAPTRATAADDDDPLPPPPAGGRPRPSGRRARRRSGNVIDLHDVHEAPRGSAARHAAVRARFEELRRTGDRRLRDALVEDHRWIASYCCQRYVGRGELLADLEQVAQLGLVIAVERYDPSFDVHFATFAIPTVLGELRRHFRDTTWALHVPRRVKELHVELVALTETLQQELRRSPAVAELAALLATDEAEVRMALEARHAYRPAPLVPAVGDEGDGDAGGFGGFTRGVEDAEYDRVEAAIVVADLLERLGPRDRRILELRFFHGCSQAEIGRRVGLSQIHVSRMLRSCLQRLHRELAG